MGNASNEGSESKEMKMVDEVFLKKMVAFVESCPNGIEFDGIDDNFNLLLNPTAEIKGSEDFDRKYVGEDATVKPLFRKEEGRYFSLQRKGDGNTSGRNYKDGEVKVIGRTVFTSFFIGAMITAPICVQAYQTETVNGIEWKYEIAGDECKIYGVWNEPRNEYFHLPTTAIPQSTAGDIVIPSVLGGRQVTGIMEFAFAFCRQITSVIIPDSVATIGACAFYRCNNLEKVVFGKGVKSIGNYALNVYDYSSSTEKSKLKTIVIKGPYFEGYNGAYTVLLSTEEVSVYVSTKWTLPKTWFFHEVQYYDPIPIIGSDVAKNLNEALYDAADERLKSLIRTEEQYNSFRTWVNGVVGTANMAKRQTMKDSSFAWLSYALDLNALLTKKPVQGDIHISDFRKDEAKDATGIVSIDNISVGADATAANLAEVFGVEGSATVDGVYSADNVIVNAWSVENGKVLFSAKPKDGSLTEFFIKATMNP